MQQGVSVVKASAGSGKTHLLTQDYISLLLDGDQQSYKHILAVTFTNKATAEMKSRVIEELYALSKEGGVKADAARARLRRILHDYSCFSISTIDRFFQTVMRSFAREIGQYASYRVELDTDAVLDQVVDLLLDSVGDPGQEALLQWLKDYSVDLVEKGESWDISSSLKTMAKKFFDEAFLLKMREAGRGKDIIGDKVSLKAFSMKLEAITGKFEQDAKAIGTEGLRLFDGKGLDPASFYYGNRGPCMLFKRWSEGDISLDYPSESRVKGAVAKFPEPEALESLFDKAREHLGCGAKLYVTVQLIRKQLYLLGIYSDLKRQLDEYLRVNNIMLLQLSTDLLSRIISDDDTPFVYEKTGNRYENLMLDEAQDTSLMQWNNFRPLFRNSQASGGRNLVVGDIKQSIYRFRGSDWRLMSEYLSRDLSHGTMHFDTLGSNWRSALKVIEFNNRIFSSIAGIIGSGGGCSGISEKISEIYSDCVQTRPEEHAGEDEGYVRLQFLEKDNNSGAGWRRKALERMISDIRDLVSENYEYKDITVLVRSNKEGAAAAAALIEAGINVITEDSLLIGNHPCISSLMALFGYIADPDNPVNALLVRGLEDRIPELHSCSLYEACEHLLDPDILSHGVNDVPFIYAFLDAVLAFQGKYGSSFRSFVKWWEESGRKISICAPDGQNAVRVMTIHKSKGLSLDAVIIPFCKESFSSGKQDVIWCSCPEFPDGPALVPLKASSELESSYFDEDYEREKMLRHVDVVNNWYVAFTRARSRLIVYAPCPNSKDGCKPSSMENVLYLILSGGLGPDAVYESGSRKPFSRRSEVSPLIDDPQPAFASTYCEGRLNLSFRSEDYFLQDGSARRKGIEMHAEMAGLDVSDELEALSGNRHWFDGTYTSMTEASVVDASGEIFRPDRVMISWDGSKLIVVDYKFGRQHPSHFVQVRKYAALFARMGYADVEGWLWYVNTGETVRV